MNSIRVNNDNEPPSCEPPSCPQPIFMMGQDSRGNWVVRDKSGTRGGLFVDRTEALRYIRSESGALVMTAERFELDLSAAVAAAPKPELSPATQRRVA